MGYRRQRKPPLSSLAAGFHSPASRAGLFFSSALGILRRQDVRRLIDRLMFAARHADAGAGREAIGAVAALVGLVHLGASALHGGQAAAHVAAALAHVGAVVGGRAGTLHRGVAFGGECAFRGAAGLALHAGGVVAAQGRLVGAGVLEVEWHGAV